MLEQEAYGVLTKIQFKQLLAKFTKQFGQPQQQKRLSFSFWNRQHKEIDTRIRITNNQAEIVQKIGRWDNVTQWDRKERIVKLASDHQQVFSAYQVFRHLLPKSEDCQIMQYDNYIFKQSDFELKLSHQAGKTSKYNFELEVFSSKTDLCSTLKELGLSSLVTVTDVEFWDNWNQKVNLNDKDLTEEQIIELIKRYI